MNTLFADTPKGKMCMTCTHSKQWPPKHAYLGLPLEEAYLSGKIGDSEMSVGTIWERVCGKTRMDVQCVECPHHLEVGCDHLGLFTRSATGVKARYSGMSVQAWKEGLR